MQNRSSLIVAGIVLLFVVVLFGGIRQMTLPGTPNAETPSPATSTPSLPDGYLSKNLRNVSVGAGDTVLSPLTITGEARTWYFEASFPVELLGGAGQRLAIIPATAEGEWMTTDFVPFRATLNFTRPVTPEGGTLVLRKDNPSGLPEHDEEVRIPVRFGSVDTKACRPTGCSGQLCAEKDVASTCEFRADYACYRTATCTRQASGECGWTVTPALTACLKNPPSLE